MAASDNADQVIQLLIQLINEMLHNFEEPNGVQQPEHVSIQKICLL